MNEQLDFEFEEYPQITTSNLPSFNQVMSNNKKISFDPHKMMVQKKQINAGQVEDTTPKSNWAEQDLKKLEEFCKQHAIFGFNCGKMSPIAALAMLKQKLGMVDNSVVERTPYSETMNKKVLLKG